MSRGTGRHRPRGAAEAAVDVQQRPVLLHYAATGRPPPRRWSERLALVAGALAVLAAIGTATLTGAWAGFSLLGPSVAPARPATEQVAEDDGTEPGGPRANPPAAATSLEDRERHPDAAGPQRPAVPTLEQRSDASSAAESSPAESSPAVPSPAVPSPADPPAGSRSAAPPATGQPEDVQADAPPRRGPTTAPETLPPQEPAARAPVREDPVAGSPAPEDPAPEDPAPEDPAPEDPAPESPAPETPDAGSPAG
ncbi:hypothetical protein E4P41_21330, partial [Geodermatophilus sp. DF01-2]